MEQRIDLAKLLIGHTDASDISIKSDTSMEYMLTNSSEKLRSHTYHQTGTLHAEQLSIGRLVRCNVSTDRKKGLRSFGGITERKKEYVLCRSTDINFRTFIGRSPIYPYASLFKCDIESVDFTKFLKSIYHYLHFALRVYLCICICAFVHHSFYIFLLSHFCIYVIVPLFNS